MSDGHIDPERFQKGFLLLLTAGISIVFLIMVRRFLTALFLAAILSGITHPLFRRLVALFRGRQILASTATVFIVLLVIVGPLTVFLGIVTSEAVQVSQQVRPWVEQQVAAASRLDSLIAGLPFAETLRPYQDEIVTKLGEIAGGIGSFAVDALTATARRTVTFIFLLFVMLYAMFFFLIDGRSVLNKILYYMPLTPDHENRMVEKFVSVARATIKGTLIIGVVQGGLAGVAFAVTGINGAAFWGTVMAVLSIVPGLGTAIIWVPAVIYLFAIGKTVAAVGLLVWCAGLVGSVDNFLRPWLVGKDTKMPDLLILLGTLGGIILFGAAGIITGPIVAALFVTVWDIYGTVFKDVLPDPQPTSLVGKSPGGGQPTPSPS